jgi:uncharacterized protein (DUF983 family)
MAQLMLQSRQRERKLYLFFEGPLSELRRAEIPEEFPVEPSGAQLEAVWRYAEVLREPSLGEMQSQAGLAMPGVRDTIVLLWRSVRLKCPHCGGGRILASWFRLKPQCPSCGLRFDRGEDEDYYLGGMMFNIALAEAIFAIVFVTTLVVMWPDVPWDNLEYILVGAMIAAPILLYPVSRVMWLAFDLLLRPMTPAEMAWHREHGEPSDQHPPQSP